MAQVVIEPEEVQAQPEGWKKISEERTSQLEWVAPKIIKRVIPQYPPLAKQTRVQGTVRLTGIIAKDGTIQQLQLISGHPLLVPAALDAVRLWHYKPYLLNDQPVEVDTQINVNFTLAGR